MSAPLDNIAKKVGIPSTPHGLRVIFAGLLGSLGGGCFGFVATGFIITSPVAWVAVVGAALSMAYIEITDEHSKEIDTNHLSENGDDSKT